MSTVWDFLDKGHVVRRGFFVVMACITWKSYGWAMAYATANPSVEAATVIAAIMTPLAGLQVAALSLYNTGRRHQREAPNDSSKS